MPVFRVNNSEDLREYEADKGLHEALKGRVPFSYQAMIRKWADEYKSNPWAPEPVTSTTSDTD